MISWYCMGKDEVNKLWRVYSCAGFKVKGTSSTVEECLYTFPFIWVSVISLYFQ